MTKTAGTVATLGATAIGGAGFAIFTGIRNLFRAKKVKKQQLEINKIRLDIEADKIALAKKYYDPEAAKAKEEKAKESGAKESLDVDEADDAGKDKKAEREAKKKERETLKKKEEVRRADIEQREEDLRTLVGTSNYLKKIKAKYKAEGDKAVISLQLKNAEFLNLDDDTIADLKEKQKEAAKYAAELEQELQGETKDLKDKAEKEGDADTKKKATPLLNKIKVLDGRLIKIKNDIEDLGGDIEAEAEAKKEERKKKEKEGKTSKETTDTDKEGAFSKVKKAIDKVAKKESIEAQESDALNEAGTKEKLEELQIQMWKLLHERQKVVIDLLKVLNKDGKNDEQIKKAENKLADIEEKLGEHGIDTSVEIDQDAIDDAQAKYDDAKDAVTSAQSNLKRVENGKNPKDADIDKATDVLTKAKARLRSAEAELKAAKKGKKVEPTKEPEKPVEPTTKTNEPTEEDLTKVQTEIDNARKAADDAKTKKEEADKGDNEMAKLEAEKAVVQAEMTRRQASQKKAKLEKDDEKSKGFETDIEADNEKIKELDKKIEEIKKKSVGGDDAKLEELNGKLETAQTKLKEVKDKKGEIDAKEGATDEEKTAAEKAVTDAQKELDDINAEIEKIKGGQPAKTTPAAGKGENDDKKKALDDEIARLEKKEKGAIASLDKVPKDKKAEVQKRIEELKAEIESFKKKRQELGESANIEALTAEAQKISSQLDKLIEDINNPNTQTYQTIEERITRMRSLLSNSEAIKKLYNK